MTHPETPTVLAERRRHLGILTLNRPKALNALSLEMIRQVTAQLLAWRADPEVGAVLLRGANRDGKVPAFCAGGDIRYFHEAAHAGDPTLEDFFSEEYALNHLIHTFGKPTLVVMDGITMGGGMGLAQGCSMRIVTEHAKLAMPETNIGLFPDVGGGWFLARMPGYLGEFLGLSGHVLGAADALAVDWADICVSSSRLDELVQAVAGATDAEGVGALSAQCVRGRRGRVDAGVAARPDRGVFGAHDLAGIVAALAAHQGEFAAALARTLAQRSPLMMAVTLELIRRARTMTLADDLRMERGLVRHCFHLRPGAASETLEGIRALVVDKDHSPRWNPAAIADVDPALVAAYFASPWPAHAHPLRDLA